MTCAPLFFTIHYVSVVFLTRSKFVISKFGVNFGFVLESAAESWMKKEDSRGLRTTSHWVYHFYGLALRT